MPGGAETPSQTSRHTQRIKKPFGEQCFFLLTAAMLFPGAREKRSLTCLHVFNICTFSDSLNQFIVALIRY